LAEAAGDQTAVVQNVLPFMPYPFVGSDEACNLCGSAQKVLICSTDRRWKPLNTVACAECGLMRTDPMPTDEELGAYYASGYRKDYQFAGSKPPRAHIASSMRIAEARIAELERWMKPGARVLDFGCGSGEFAYLAQEAGCEVTAFDPGSDYLDFAKQEYGVEAFSSRWEDADLEAGSFDVITCFHVVEHLRQPVEAMAQMAQWLDDEGVVHIAVPDMRPNHKPSFDRFHFAHVHGFISETLEAAALQAGLAPVQAHLTTTSGLFAKPGSAHDTVTDLPIRDPKRVDYLVESYPDDSIAKFLLTGKFAAQASHRFKRWRRDFLTPSRR
jgi:2-polyprenyl-3-methyl-5-hydroxy-6-metoxy-1,4-benzoquinol methylase